MAYEPAVRQQIARVGGLMRDLIESLSLFSGAVVVALASTAVVWLLCSLVSGASRSLFIYLAPLVLAYCIYWLPVWLGSDGSEYAPWQALCVGTWFVAGAIPSALVTAIFRRRAP